MERLHNALRSKRVKLDLPEALRDNIESAFGTMSGKLQVSKQSLPTQGTKEVSRNVCWYTTRRGRIELWPDNRERLFRKH